MLKTYVNFFFPVLKERMPFVFREYFAGQIKDSTNQSGNLLDSAEEYGEGHRKCVEINEQWNAEVKQLREQTLAKEKEVELQEILDTIEETRIKMEERQQHIEEIVRLEKVFFVLCIINYIIIELGMHMEFVE